MPLTGSARSRSVIIHQHQPLRVSLSSKLTESRSSLSMSVLRRSVLSRLTALARNCLASLGTNKQRQVAPSFTRCCLTFPWKSREARTVSSQARGTDGLPQKRPPDLLSAVAYVTAKTLQAREFPLTSNLRLLSSDTSPPHHHRTHCPCSVHAARTRTHGQSLRHPWYVFTHCDAVSNHLITRQQLLTCTGPRL